MLLTLTLSLSASPGCIEHGTYKNLGWRSPDCSVVSTKEVSHVDVFLLLLGLLLLDGGGSGGTGGGAGSGASSGGALESISLLEGVVGAERGGGEVLEGVEHEVLGGARDNIAGAEGEGGDVLGGALEDFEDGLLGDGEDLGVVDLAGVEERLDMHLVLEGTDLQLVEEGGLTGGDLLVGANNLDGVDNLDLGLHNLGLDVQGLEEGSLLGVKTGGSSGDGHISGSEGANLGGGLTDLGVKNGLDLGEVSVGEDESGVERHLGGDASVLLVGGGLIEVTEGLLDESLLKDD